MTEGTIRILPHLARGIAVALKHLRLQIEYSGEHLGVLQMRKHIGWYIKGLPHAARVRLKLHELERPEDVERLLTDYLSEADRLSADD